MTYRPTRAHRRFVSLPGGWVPDAGAQLKTVHILHLNPVAQAQLAGHLHLTGTFRSGPMFGLRQGDALQVLHAAPAGYLTWAEDDPARPFRLDGRYVLGWADALGAALGRQVEWIGSWLVCPDAGLPAPEAREELLGLARQEGLADEHHPLLFAGYRSGEPAFEAYGSGADDQVQALQVVRETPPPGNPLSP